MSSSAPPSQIPVVRVSRAVYDAILALDCKALVVERPFPLVRRHEYVRVETEDAALGVVTTHARCTWVQGTDRFYVLSIVPSQPTMRSLEIDLRSKA